MRMILLAGLMSMAAAEAYYEAEGRTWERAAYIKARVSQIATMIARGLPSAARAASSADRSCSRRSSTLPDTGPCTRARKRPFSVKKLIPTSRSAQNDCSTPRPPYKRNGKPTRPFSMASAINSSKSF